MLLPIPIRSRCWIWIHTSRGCPVGVCLKLYFMLARRFNSKKEWLLTVLESNELNNKFSSYSWDAIINRKKNWSPAPARTLQDEIKENSTLHLYRTASYSNSLISFTGYKCKKGKIISSFIIKYSLWCVNLLISEILKSVCVFPEFVTRLKRSVSKQATEQSWSKYFLNLIAFLSFKTS